MKMDLFRSRTSAKKSQKSSVKSPRQQSETTEIDIDSLARVISNEAGQMETEYSQGGSTERSSRSTARTGTVDDILESDDDESTEIFIDEEDENEDGGLKTSQTWDETYGNAPANQMLRVPRLFLDLFRRNREDRRLHQ